MGEQVVILSGSPSAASRSTLVARALASEVEAAGLRTVAWALGDFDPSDVVFGRSSTPALTRFIESVKAAAALVLASPVYKASYSGALKAVVDVVPPDALTGRPALGIATARLPAHGPEVDRAYRALFSFFKARAVDTLVVLDDEVNVGAPSAGGSSGVLGPAEKRVRLAARALVAAVRGVTPEAAAS